MTSSKIDQKRASAEWLQRPAVRQIYDAFSREDEDVRAVGGAVRDTLLGRSVKDVDFATPAPPERVMEIAGQAGIKAVPTGIDHGTVTLVIDSQGFEITTLRRDVETYGRRAKVDYTDDWVEDARRRDFTINALYMDGDGNIFDPLGGLADVEARKIRFIGDAQERVREDYLRILRFFRFSSELDTDSFDPEALSACIRERDGLRDISAERIQGEVMRLVTGPGAARALEAMFDHGLLVQVLGGVPHLERLKRLIAIEVENGLEPDSVLRLAALCVDVAEDAERLAHRLRLSNVERVLLENTAFHRDVARQSDTAGVKLLLYRLGKSGARASLLIAWAASGDGPGDKVWSGLLDTLAKTPRPEFPLKGADIVELGISEGPAVGDILKRIESRWAGEGFTATRGELLDLAREMALSNG